MKNLFYLAVVLLFSCNIFSAKDTVLVTINLGDRALPSSAGIEKIILEVTGEGYTTVTKEFSSDYISIELPPGNNLQFKIKATGAGGDTLFSGSTKVNLVLEETTDLKISLKSSLNTIKSFKLKNLGVNGVISNEEITVTVPFNTTLSSIIPEIEHNGVSISLMSPIDLEKPFEYKVTAADGGSKTYKVTIVKASSSAKEITSFSFIQAGIIDNAKGEITVLVPYDTDLTKLTPVIVHTGASISPLATDQQNFTSPVTYTVTAVDGTTKNYKVTVTKDITAKTMFYFGFNSLNATAKINQTTGNIIIRVPQGTDISSLIPNINHTGVSISPLATTPQNFTSNVTYTVSAYDGSSKVYTVTVGFISDAPSNLSSYSAGEYYFTLKNRADFIGSVWGTDIYTTDSSLLNASIHSGILNSNETEKIVKVYISTGKPYYIASTKNNVSATTWGSYSSSFQVALPEQVYPPYFYINSNSLEIATSEAGANIRYTTDGSIPTELSGEIYSSQISSLSSPLKIKAIAYKEGLVSSLREINVHKIIYNETGDKPLLPEFILEGTRFTAPVPSKYGYTFVGWFNSDFSIQYTASNVIYSDLTVYGKWEISNSSRNVFNSSVPFATTNILGMHYDGTYFLVANFGLGKMYRYSSLEGGVRDEYDISTTQSICDITSDSTYYYILSYAADTIYRMSKATMTLESTPWVSLGSGSSYFSMAIDTNYIYVAHRGGVKRITKSDSSVVNFGTGLPTSSELPNIVISSDLTTLYARFENVIYKISTTVPLETQWENFLSGISGSTNTITWNSTNVNNGKALEFDGENLYFTDGTILKSFNLVSKAVTTIDSEIGTNNYFMARTPTRLYISDYSQGTIYFYNTQSY